MGVHGHMLNTLRSMYASVGMRVRLKSRLGESFLAETGMKQGDPLSPLLFGLFIDRFEGYLASTCGAMGVPLAQGLLRVLLYADDLTLTASSAEQLQEMLDRLHDFAKAFHLTVNVAKSVVVVFNRARWTGNGFTYAGGELPISTEFTYLGVKLQARAPVADAVTAGISKARVALHGMVTRCRELGHYNVMVQKRLFEALVVSVLNYGCQVWAPYHLASLARAAWGEKAPVEDLQKCFLRYAFQVPTTTTVAVMMSEARCQPLMHTWFKLTVNWYNSMVVRRANDLVRCALVDSLALAAAGNTACWGAEFLKAVGGVDPECADRVRCVSAVPTNAVLDMLDTRWRERSWGAQLVHRSDTALRDIEDSQGFKAATYRHWFCHDRVGADEPARCPVDKREGFAYHVNHPQQIRTLATFRMSAHHLNIERLRHKVPAVPRSRRFCSCCNAQAVEDEMHVLECPRYGALRDMFLDGHTQTPMTDATMYAVMNPTTPDGWKRLAVFLHKVFLQRVAHVASAR
jgi:Reverse transcriptase (RNA-dependent DNA polymerase)